MRRPLVDDPTTMVALARTYEHGQCCNYFPAPVYRDLREQTQSFSGVAAYYDAVPASIGAGSASSSSPLTGDRICAASRFENSVLPWFGLPGSLPSR